MYDNWAATGKDAITGGGGSSNKKTRDTLRFTRRNDLILFFFEVTKYGTYDRYCRCLENEQNRTKGKGPPPPPITALGKYGNYSKNSLVSKLKFYTMGFYTMTLYLRTFGLFSNLSS